MFTLEQVRGFVAVAEELHFGRAAERLQMTQPPLSRQIQKLERAVGARLLDRDQRSVSLTAAGTAFLIDARRMLATADTALVRAQRVEAGATGTVRIAFTAGSSLGVLPAILDIAARTLPDVDLDLVEMVTADQVTHLHEGSIDVGLARPTFEGDALESRLIQREELVLAVPTGHRWAGRRRPVGLGELGDERLIMYSAEPARYFHDLVVGLLPPGARVVHTVTQVLTMLSLVAAGRGIALVPASSKAMRLDGVAYLDLDGVRAQPVELHLLWATDNPNPAAQALLAQVWESLGAVMD